MGNDLLDVSVVIGVNERKRNWSKQSKSSITNKDNTFGQIRKRRRMFHETMSNMNSHKNTMKDLEIMNGSKQSMKEIMHNLRNCVFGNANIRSNDSFEITNRRNTKIEKDAQNKLISAFASKTEIHSNNKLMIDQFMRNNVSIYGQSKDVNSWKNSYKLILDQRDDDLQHIEKHNNMGNYTTYTDKLRIAKKSEFRNPYNVESEYSNYALSLSFGFLQERINKYNEQQKKNVNRGRSYLETEHRLKSNELLS